MAGIELPSGAEMEVDAGPWIDDAYDELPPSPSSSAGDADWDVAALLRRQAALLSLPSDVEDVQSTSAPDAIKLLDVGAPTSAEERFFDAFDVMPPSPADSAGERFFDALDVVTSSPITPTEDFDRDTRLSVYLHRQVSLLSQPLDLRVVRYVRRGFTPKGRQHQDSLSSRIQELLSPHSRPSSRILQEGRRSSVDSRHDLIADTCADARGC